VSLSMSMCARLLRCCSVIVRETRHPNVVLYLGLSRAPDPDGRIFIISEFIDNGQLLPPSYSGVLPLNLVPPRQPPQLYT
jgi:hypothetical protein